MRGVIRLSGLLRERFSYKYIPYRSSFLCSFSTVPEKHCQSKDELYMIQVLHNSLLYVRNILYGRSAGFYKNQVAYRTCSLYVCVPHMAKQNTFTMLALWNSRQVEKNYFTTNKLCCSLSFK